MKEIEFMYIETKGIWKGYRRFKSNKELVHRWKARTKIYNLNKAYYKEKYPNHSFRQLVVHHKDGNKLNNSLKNLEIMTQEEHDDIHTDFNYGKRRFSRRKLRVLAIVILMLFVIASSNFTSQGSNYKTDRYGEQLVVEEIPAPVIQSFQFEFQKQIMTNEEIIAEVNAQIDKYKSEARPMRERNVHYLAEAWDLSEELTSTPTSNPLSYSIFTETIDGKTVQIEFKTDGLKHMVGSSNYEILIT